MKFYPTGTVIALSTIKPTFKVDKYQTTMSDLGFNMRVDKKNPVFSSQLTYDQRRRHLRQIIFSDDNDLTLTTVAKLMGKESRSQYKYVQQVLAGYAGKESESVLDEVEHTLRVNNYWKSPEETIKS